MGPPFTAPRVAGFVSVISRAYVGNISHAKPQRRKGTKPQRRKGKENSLETRQRFAPLRLCARNISPLRRSPMHLTCG